MIERIKKFWEAHYVGNFLSMAAGMTVMIVFVTALFWVIYQLFKVVLVATGLIWVLYAWVIGSFSYIVYTIIHDIREFEAKEAIDETCRRMPE